jgi:DNA polymerase V
MKQSIVNEMRLWYKPKRQRLPLFKFQLVAKRLRREDVEVFFVSFRVSLRIFKPDFSTCAILPLYLSRVCAGFPSPADDFIDQEIDLNRQLIRNPLATFIVHAEGDSMEGCGIYSGDALIVDRSLAPKHDSIVIACLDGEMTVKKLIYREGKPYLVAANPNYPTIEIREGDELIIWGVVTKNIHDLLP